MMTMSLSLWTETAHMDEFFEQVGAAPPPLPKHQQTWGGHISSQPARLLHTHT